MLNTTIGQLLVNDALPEELRDHNRVLDKKGMHRLLEQVAREHPEKYREISFKLNQVGQRAAQDQGGMSFSARHLKRSRVANETRTRIRGELSKVLENDDLSDQQRADNIVRIVGKEMEPQQKAILEEAIKDKNPLAMQVLSGSRGKPMNLASLLGGDMLYSDHRDEVIPIPVLSSYSEGLTPEEYWAGTYGARRGIIATKFATQDAGFLSKQLNQAGHRLIVMDEEGDDDPNRGMIADTDDMDNEGSLLSQDIGPYKRNTPLTPKILKHLKRLGKNRILVRSPLVGGSPEGGVYARDVGIRETGKLPGRGEQVGLQAAQALSEPISQGQLSAKHSGGVAGQEKAVGGFQAINQLIQVPKKMRGGASHSEQDGKVQRVEEAPAGGHYVTVNDQQHYVGDGYKVTVKKGDEIEAGDLLSDGIPNPALIVKHKGVGEGRRYFVNEFRKSMADSGMQGHRRNIEILARGLINHVKMTDETDDHAPDDIIPYSTLEHTYKPREDHQVLNPKKAIGQYLERPVLHYSIGTKIRPSMLKDFEEFGIGELPVHKSPPPFEPHMVRGMYQLQHDPDWMTQMYGSGLKKSLLNSTARGATSDARGTSFVSSLVDGTDFGEDPTRAVIQPKAPYELPKLENELKPDIPAAPVPAPVAEPKKPIADTFFGGRFKIGMAKKAMEAPEAPKASGGSSAMPSGTSPLKVTPAGFPGGAKTPTPTPLTPVQRKAQGPLISPSLMPNTPPALAGTPQSSGVSAPAPAPQPTPTPPTASPAQARTDRVQKSRTRSSDSGNLWGDIQAKLFGLPRRDLAGNNMTRDMSRQSSRALGVAAARQPTDGMQRDESAARNQRPQRRSGPLVPYAQQRTTPVVPYEETPGIQPQHRTPSPSSSDTTPVVPYEETPGIQPQHRTPSPSRSDTTPPGSDPFVTPEKTPAMIEAEVRDAQERAAESPQSVGGMVADGAERLFNDGAELGHSSQILREGISGKLLSPKTPFSKPINLGVQKGLTVAKDVGSRTPLVKHLFTSSDDVANAAAATTKAVSRTGKVIQAVGNTVKTVTKPIAAAATAAGTGLKAVSKVVGPAGFLIEGGLMGKDMYDRVQSGDSLDKVWTDKANEKAKETQELFTNWDDGAHELYMKPLDLATHVLNPVSSVQMGTELVRESAGGAADLAVAGAGKVRDLATWSTPESRQVEEQKELSEAQGAAEQEELAAQKAHIRQTLNSKGQSLSPVQRLKLKQQHKELDARTQDSIDSSAAMTDETADWELGKQHTFGGGHYFQDAMAGTENRLTAKIKTLEQSDNLNEEQQQGLDNMKQRRNETTRLKQTYNREVGYFGEGDFSKVVRIGVRGAKQQVVSIRQRMREPNVKRNAKLMSQLRSDYKHHEQRLTNFRSWADQAKAQKVKQ